MNQQLAVKHPLKTSSGLRPRGPRAWSRIIGLWAVVLGLAALTACGGDSEPARLPPSVTVEDVGIGGRITLTQEAVERLKLRVEQVQERAITLKRSAEVLYLPELGGAVSASENGTVLAAPGAQVKAGDHVTQGQVLLRIAPVNGGAPIDVTSPRDGTFVRLRTAVGQRVAPGQAMFEVADLSRVWVWVPLSNLDLGRVAADRAVSLKTSGQSSALTAQPAQAPASLAGLALFYSVDAPNHGLFPGQRLEVELAETTGTRRVLPYSAVVYDSKGASWVYASTESNVFRREPVTVDFVEGTSAIVSSGPVTGTFIAAVGASELYSSEVGVGRDKSQTGAIQQ